MALGIILVTASLIGIIYGIRKRSKAMIISSVILLTMVLAVWYYFYNNPY